MSPELTIARLDRLSRQRALTLAESLELEDAIAAFAASGRQAAWAPDQDALAQALRARGQSYGQISRRLRRSPDAVASRLRLLERRTIEASAAPARPDERGRQM